MALRYCCFSLLQSPTCFVYDEKQLMACVDLRQAAGGFAIVCTCRVFSPAIRPVAARKASLAA